ncbi:MAG: M20/M25/M40 family metallo-hydrolase [Bacteroidetes bacterium]|nr:M20/M25/M40 family metallo-hydrolase [Bacteroidota bacterium]
MVRCILLACLSFYTCLPSALSQKIKKADKQILDNLESEIHYLADDKLEGRRAGTNGEKLASDFITGEFQKINLQPKGENSGWLQSFVIYDGKQIKDAHFIVNDKELLLNKDFFPLAFSAIKTVEGSVAIALQESGVPWFIDIKEIVEPNLNNPHFDVYGTLSEKVKDYQKKGATAVVFFNSSKKGDDIAFDPKDKLPTSDLPVLYITKEAKRKYMRDESASVDLKIVVDIGDKLRTGHNVIGYIDNAAANTIILGAHYDHLGYGEDGNSLYKGTEKMIHNGADDNASGTAAMIELARMLKKSKLKKNNYLFIAFSGEELGLFGSKYFSDHPTIDLSKVNYMLNMDMVGRLNDSSHILTIGGYGTSPVWGELFSANDDKKFFTIKFDSSGTGPSDHTSFYRKDIPVLFFFTGLHSDYHKPTDDFDKINYAGELQVVKYIYSLLEDLNKKGKLAFTKTRETQTMSSTRFSVTLGIMPDYTFSGSGVRVDGVSDGRPAQKAGLKIGDIIVKLGDYPVSSLETYMQALSTFKKGDKTTVAYKRGNENGQAEIQFNQ